MSKYHTDCNESMKSITNIFPIEVDLPAAMLNDLKLNDYEDEDEGILVKEDGEEEEQQTTRVENLINTNDEDLLGLK